ncbi:MAG: ThiS family protein [Chloroflexi bacterium]|jgi:sulfur carrier protein ThiS|nr:MAG: ThiS family protein [Chloroflexota bacterium]
MQVTVEILGSSELLLPEGETRTTIDLAAGSTVQDAMRALGAKDGGTWNASIDGQLVYAETPLEDGAQMLIFAAIQGGDRRQPIHE